MEGGTPEGGAWLVDMVVQFMKSPSWNDPLVAFIDEKCTLFDNFAEECRHEEVEIHNTYKNLVDDLLTAHLLEVDMEPEDFEKACAEAKLAEDPRFQQVIKKLDAVEDFVKFKQMMIDAHIKQQTQAEATYKEVTDAEAAAAVAVAEAADREEAERAAAVAAVAAAEAAAVPDMEPTAAAPAAAPAPAPAVKADPSKVPTAQDERAFGAAGGSYGRASMATGPKKAGSNEKASAIRKALMNSVRP